VPVLAFHLHITLDDEIVIRSELSGAGPAESGISSFSEQNLGVLGLHPERRVLEVDGLGGGEVPAAVRRSRDDGISIGLDLGGLLSSLLESIDPGGERARVAFVLVHELGDEGGDRVEVGLVDTAVVVVAVHFPEPRPDLVEVFLELEGVGVDRREVQFELGLDRRLFALHGALDRRDFFA
jgi:hypothetical protein